MNEFWILILIWLLGVIGGWHLQKFWKKGIKIHQHMCPKCQGFGWHNEHIVDEKYGVKTDSISQVKCDNCIDGAIKYRPFFRNIWKKEADLHDQEVDPETDRA